jgi:3-dehydroquinate dehydratase type I
VTPKICVSILPKTNIEALNFIEKAENAHADLIEVRLDSLENSRKLSDLSSHTKIPLIATNKLLRESGNFSGTQTERRQTLLNAAKSGFEYVDLDLSSPKLKEQIKELNALGAKTIVSYHKFDGPLTIQEMNRILEEEISSGANVCKIIPTAKQVQDNLTALNFVSANANRAKLVCFCMGELGKTSRLLSPVFGAFFTFASLEQGSETAPGQISIREMKTAYSVLGQKQ